MTVVPSVMARIRACVVIFLAFLATSAFGSTATLSLQPAGPYHGGDSVRVRWSGLPADILELELLLVRGGAVDDVIRMTPQLDPRRGEFVWRVPELGAEDAILLLRAGNEREEIELAESRRFSILPRDAADALLFLDGEWWDGGRVDPLNVDADAAIDTPHARMQSRKPMEASRVRGRMPVAIVVSDPSDVTVVATAEPERRRTAAPLTIPQRK